ncbi:hypothetical protein [Desulfosediminicola sp.]|uniref:hypothetical protein n=1 Tax=Desulfosediminicola sp. TaxID=2886825 RepID=UPI003AF20D3B
MTGFDKRPSAVCTDCIRYSFHSEDVGTSCGRIRGQNVCKGIFVDTSDPINWKECTACDGTGKESVSIDCVACQGSGWILTRRRS